MPRLSIIIPTLGNWEALEDTLVSVLQNRPPRSEVIVVHGGAYEDPYDLKDEVRFVEAPARSRPVEVINAGLLAARSELINVLPCGAVVDDGWTIAAVRHFADSRVGVVAPVVLDVNHPATMLSAGCYWLPEGREAACASGQRLSDLGTSEGWTGPDSAVAFYRRSALGEVGSFDATLSPRYAAIDLSLRLTHAGHRVILEPTSHVFFQATLLGGGGPFRQAWQRERLFWRHARKHGLVPSIAAHGWLLLTETLKSIPRPRAVAHLAGCLVGLCDVRGPRLPKFGPSLDAAGPALPVERRVDQPHIPLASPPRAGTRPSRSPSEARSRAR